MNAERAIHIGIFFLLLVGLTGLSAWVSYTNLQDNMVLLIAIVPLSWGVILLVLYLSFKRIDWKWWS